MRNAIVKVVFLLGILLIATSPQLLTAKESLKPMQGDKDVIAVINEPVNLIVKEIVGDLFETVVILPPGTDPHSFSLTPDLVSKLEESKLIVLIDPDQFQLEKSIITNDQLKAIPYLSVTNYSKYGWEYHSVLTIKTNFHGSWLYPNNGLAIAKALTDYLKSRYPQYEYTLETNLEEFQNSIFSLKSQLSNLTKFIDVSRINALLMVPGVYYVVNFTGIKVGDIVLTESGAYPSASRIAEIEAKLKKGELNLIVAPLEAKGSRVGELAEQLSQETGVPVAYVATFSSFGFSKYKDLIQFDVSSIISVSVNVKSSVTGGEISDFLYWFIIGVLSLIVVAEAYIIFKYRRLEMEEVE